MGARRIEKQVVGCLSRSEGYADVIFTTVTGPQDFLHGFWRSASAVLFAVHSTLFLSFCQPH
jgi:hypothetical protein